MARRDTRSRRASEAQILIGLGHRLDRRRDELRFGRRDRGDRAQRIAHAVTSSSSSCAIDHSASSATQTWIGRASRSARAREYRAAAARIAAVALARVKLPPCSSASASCVEIGAVARNLVELVAVVVAGRRDLLPQRERIGLGRDAHVVAQSIVSSFFGGGAIEIRIRFELPCSRPAAGQASPPRWRDLAGRSATRCQTGNHDDDPESRSGQHVYETHEHARGFTFSIVRALRGGEDR